MSTLHVVVGTSNSTELLGVEVTLVAVFNRDLAATVFARTDGATAVVEADGTYAVPPGTRRVLPVETSGNTEVDMIATAAGIDVELEF